MKEAGTIIPLYPELLPDNVFIQDNWHLMEGYFTLIRRLQDDKRISRQDLLKEIFSILDQSKLTKLITDAAEPL